MGNPGILNVTGIEFAHPTGMPKRIRTLAEARQALGIPNRSDDELLRIWGVPAEFQLAAVPVNDPSEPDLVAECAALITVRKHNGRLHADRAGTRLRLREKSNALWIITATIVRAADNVLVIGNFTIAPAFEGQLSRKGDDTALGISSELLRLLSPARLLNEATEYLERQNSYNRRLREITSPNHTTPRSAPPKTRQPYVGETQVIEIAKRYLTLCSRGHRHPLPQLAEEFGISRTQARDRVHKARELGYLKPGKQGRAGAEIGPRLKELGSPPPSTPGN